MSSPLASRSMLDWFAEREPVKPPPIPDNQFADWVNSLPETFEADRSVRQSFVCRWCLNPVFQVPHSVWDYSRLRSILMMPDRIKDPPICNSCFDAVVSGFNYQATNVGTRNDGPTNLALSKLPQVEPCSPPVSDNATSDDSLVWCPDERDGDGTWLPRKWTRWISGLLHR